MYCIDVHEDVECQVQRYQIVGNDSTFKAYTRDNNFFNVASQQNQSKSLEDAVLIVKLKEQIKSSTA